MCSPSRVVVNDLIVLRRSPTRLRSDERDQRRRSRSAATKQIVDSGARTFNRATISSSTNCPISLSVSLARRFLSSLGIRSAAAKRSAGLLERNRRRCSWMSCRIVRFGAPYSWYTGQLEETSRKVTGVLPKISVQSQKVTRQPDGHYRCSLAYPALACFRGTALRESKFHRCLYRAKPEENHRGRFPSTCQKSH